MNSSLRRRPLTADELSERSGVSKSTIFRYYAGQPVRPALRTAIESVLRGHDPAPGSHALNEVLIAVSPAHRSFRGYYEVIQGVVERLEPRGGHVLIVPGPASATLCGPQGGWLILGKTLDEEAADAEALEAAGVPFVLVNRDYPEASWNSVGANLKRAAADAVTHLLNLGHRRIAVLAERTDQFQPALRKVEGYRLAFAEAGLPVPEDLIAPRETATLDEELTGLMARGATACFCLDDELAFSVLRWAFQKGLNVPGDLAVLGFNDLEPSQFFAPSLSSVRIPFRALGTAAADTLELLVDEPLRRGLRMELRHEVVVRESTGQEVSR